MRARNAFMTAVTGLMLSAGIGNTAFAQSYRYGDVYERDYRYERGYRSGNYWYAQRIVREAYREILRREPDRSGLREYTDAILYRGWSERDVRRSLLQSAEYRRNFGRTHWYSRRY